MLAPAREGTTGTFDGLKKNERWGGGGANTSGEGGRSVTAMNPSQEEVLTKESPKRQRT